MKKKAAVSLLLAVCMIFGGFAAVISADNATLTEIKGSYTVIASGSGETAGAQVTFVSSNGERYITYAAEDNAVGSYRMLVPAGRYDITVSRRGYLKNTIKNVVVGNSSVQMDHGELFAGDLNGDGVVNINDILLTSRIFDGLLPCIDISGDGKINADDLNIIKRNMMMTDTVTEYTNITGLLCDFREDPLGIDYKNPYLSWKMDSGVRGQKQTGYRIVVSSSLEKLEAGEYDMWDKSSENSENGVYYNGAALAPRSEYYWTVFVSDKDGNIVAPGRIAKFETALFGDFGEKNKWIAASDRNFDMTTAVIEANVTLANGAVGVNFCKSEDGSSFLMWQINVTSGKVMFRPHTCKNDGYGTITEVDISNIFPTVDSIIGKPVTLKMDIKEGTVVTYINDIKVHTYTNRNFVGRAGFAELRVAGGEAGTLNWWKIYDENGEMIYEVSGDTVLPYAAPLFRKSFSTQSGKIVEKARLYVTSAGTHEMYLNGERCSDDYLAPGKSEFSKVLYYQTYDITDLILEGENTVACQLGMGWYNGGPIGATYGTNIGLKAKLIVTYADGTEQIVDTDSTWLSNKNGPVTVNYFYQGEYIDARKGIYGWNENGLDTASWGGVTATEKIGAIQNNFVAENTNPIRAIHELHPISVANPAEKTYVYTFPANISATVRITASAPAGTEIHLKYSEFLTSGGLADTSWFIVNEARGNQNGEDNYIFAGNGEETFEFSFVYHGFQYLEIFGLPESIPTENITALILSTDSTRTGYFESSNELLNSYYNNVIRSQESNFIGAITDCPTREKNNWTGDAQGFAYAATYNFNEYNIYRSFQEMTRHAQGTSGIVPEVVPIGSGRAGDTMKSPSGWSDTVIMIPWQLYFQYGDETFLTDSYDAMKLWADYLIRTCKLNGYVRNDGWYGDNAAFDRTMVAEENLPEIGTAYSAYSIGILSKIAGILGNVNDEAYYKSESEKFAAAWRKNFLEEDGYTCKTKTQTSYAMGIYYDLYETPEQKQKAADFLSELVRTGDPTKGIPANSQVVGFIGYPILYYTLSQNGHADTAFAVLEQTNQPSILYPVTQGATTTWEYYIKGASLNHFFSGCVSSWLYTDVLGITHDYKTENVAYRHFVLRPTYGGSLTYAKGSYDSQSGIIESEWNLSEDGKTFTYKCTVPANTTATLGLPTKSENVVITEGGCDVALSEGVSFVKNEDGRVWYEITSGKYEFSVVNK